MTLQTIGGTDPAAHASAAAERISRYLDQVCLHVGDHVRPRLVTSSGDAALGPQPGSMPTT
jgi:hypothetical protein